MGSSSLYGLAVVLGVANLIYFIGLAIYRVYFHPLAKYPGPLLWKITQWPETRSAWTGNRHIDLQLLHERYGDVVRFGPDKLSFRSAQALNDIYTDRKANMIKTGWTHAGEMMNSTNTTHSISNRQLHAGRRKLLNTAFSERALSGLHKYIDTEINRWCSYLDQGKERDMGVWSTLLTVDVLGELCFGKSFGAMKNGASEVIEMLMASTRVQQQSAFIPFRELLFPWMRPERLGPIGRIFNIRSFILKVRFREDAVELVKQRFALEKEDRPEEEKRKDFFHYIYHAKDPETGNAFAPQDLGGEAAVLIGAGSDTSSTALSSLFFYLLRDERALKKLQEEIRSNFDEVTDIQYSAKLTNMQYLRACIDEAMRMSPPVPGYLDRLVLPGGADIDGHHVPASTVVGVAAYSVHHNEAYFPDSFKYLPERWIASDESSAVAKFPVTSSSVERAKSAYHPFSSGPRGCVGKNMAYMELLTAVARVMFLFDVNLKKGDHSGEGGGGMHWAKGPGRQRKGEYQLKDFLIADREGPIVEFHRREGVQLAAVAA